MAARENWIFWNIQEKLSKIKKFVLSIKFLRFFSFLLHFPSYSSTLVMWKHIFWAFNGNFRNFLKTFNTNITFQLTTKIFIHKNFQKLMILHDPTEIFYIQHLHTILHQYGNCQLHEFARFGEFWYWMSLILEYFH